MNYAISLKLQFQCNIVMVLILKTTTKNNLLSVTRSFQVSFEFLLVKFCLKTD